MPAVCEACSFDRRAVLLVECTPSIATEDDSDTLNKPATIRDKVPIQELRVQEQGATPRVCKKSREKRCTCTRPALSIGRLLLGLGWSIREGKNGGGLADGCGGVGSGFAAI